MPETRKRPAAVEATVSESVSVKKKSRKGGEITPKTKLKETKEKGRKPEVKMESSQEIVIKQEEQVVIDSGEESDGIGLGFHFTPNTEKTKKTNPVTYATALKGSTPEPFFFNHLRLFNGLSRNVKEKRWTQEEFKTKCKEYGGDPTYLWATISGNHDGGVEGPINQIKWVIETLAEQPPVSVMCFEKRDRWVMVKTRSEQQAKQLLEIGRVYHRTLGALIQFREVKARVSSRTALIVKTTEPINEESIKMVEQHLREKGFKIKGEWTPADTAGKAFAIHVKMATFTDDTPTDIIAKETGRLIARFLKPSPCNYCRGEDHRFDVCPWKNIPDIPITLDWVHAPVIKKLKYRPPTTS